MHSGTSNTPVDTVTFTAAQDGVVVVISGAIGPTGKLWVQYPSEFAYGDAAYKTRTDAGRLKNATIIKSHFDDYSAVPDASVDKVIWILGPHEVYFTPPNTQGLGDPAKAYAEIKRVLKPGGRFLFLLNHPLLQTPGSGWIDDHILAVAGQLTETSAGRVRDQDAPELGAVGVRVAHADEHVAHVVAAAGVAVGERERLQLGTHQRERAERGNPRTLDNRQRVRKHECDTAGRARRPAHVVCRV